MESQITPRSMSVNSAENAIKKSISSFYLLEFNYPSEAIDCIIQLYLALELLLREQYKQDDIRVDGWDAITLIDFSQDWSSKEKNLAHWLREKRNMLQHSGETSWEEVEVVKDQLLKIYRLVGSMYQNLGYGLVEIFSAIEQKILNGNKLDWTEEAHSLAIVSFKYLDDEPEIALQIANGAFVKAFRGYAKCCRIQDAEILPLSILIEVTENTSYQFEADVPVSWVDTQGRGLIRDPLDTIEGGDTYYNLRPNPLLNYTEIIGNRDNPALRLRKELDRNLGIVDALIADAPNWDYFECVANHWDKITNELQARYPELKIPKLKENLYPEQRMSGTCGIAAWWDKIKLITIHFEGDIKQNGWEEQHTETLLEIINMVCGEKPDDLEIDIRDDTFHPWTPIQITIIKLDK